MAFPCLASCSHRQKHSALKCPVSCVTHDMRTPPSSLVPRLMPILYAPMGIPWLRRSAAIVLLALALVGCYGSDASVDRVAASAQLQRLLIDPSSEVRRTVVVAMGRIGASGSTEAIVLRLKDQDARVRQAAAWALGVLSEQASPAVGLALADALADPSHEVRLAAAQALGEMGEERQVTEVILLRLRSSDEAVRLAAVYALLGRSGFDPSHLKAMATARSESSGRQAAIAVLGERGSAAVIPLLAERLTMDSDANVRAEAAYRLGLLGLGDSRAIEALHQADARERDSQVRRWVAAALREVTSAGGRD